jgi:hypothetical protein
MAYRDDREADQARIASLERDLATARDRVAQLEDHQSQALVLASSDALAPAGRPSAAQSLFGPGTLQLTRRFDGEYPVDRFHHLIDRIRELTRDPGRTELLRSSLTWSTSRLDNSSGPCRVVTVTVRNGFTTLAVTDRLSGLAGAIYGGVGGGVGGGGLSLSILVAATIPALVPVFVLGWLGGVFFGTREIYVRAARRRAIALQRLHDALVTDIERALRTAADDRRLTSA